VSEVFISYSRKDGLWLERIRNFLIPRLQQKNISIWSDSQINPGESWIAAIQDAIRNSQAAILLISDSYLESQSSDMELRAIFNQADAGKLQVFPIIVSSINNLPLMEKTLGFRAVNNPSQPLDSVSGDDQSYILDHLNNLIRASVKPGKENKKDSISGDKYAGAMNQAAQIVTGNVIGSIGVNIFGDSNQIFYQAEQKLEKKDDK
jgi:hypothetical protein